MQSSAPEVRDIIERGVADAVTFPWGSLLLFGIDKVTKYRHGGAALRHDVRLRHQQGQVQPDVRQARRRRSTTTATPKPPARSASPGARWRTPASTRSRRSPATRSTSSRRSRSALWKKAAEPLVKTWADGVKKNGERSGRGAWPSLRAALTKYNALAQIKPLTHARRQGCSCRPALPPPLPAVRSGHESRVDGSFHRHHRMDRRRLCRHRCAQHFRRASSCATRSNYAIPDSFDIGRMLLGILIFWGIAATSYRGGHITVDLIWANVGPKYQRMDRRVRDPGAAVRGGGADLDVVRQGAQHLLATTCSPSTCTCRPGRSSPWPGPATSPPCC